MQWKVTKFRIDQFDSTVDFISSLFIVETIQYNATISFKGYLHYKTITPQNVLSEGQVKIFFIL